MKSSIILIVVMPIVSCTKPFKPYIIAVSVNYLVVEGIINSGADSTIIKLSRTVNLSGATSSKPEANAAVSVENDQNNVVVLNSNHNGTYTVAALNLDTARKYRLRIKTSDNKTYLSDLVPVKITPPIDSIGYTVKENGLQVYVNTHDVKNNTRYYRWDFDETWLFHAAYFSNWISTGTKIVQRTPDQLVYYCYAHYVSSTVIVNSSAKLKQDVVYQAPISMIPSTSEKIEAKYSILLRQYALTPDAYTFWQVLKKNTEQVGGIFDAQPSQLKGNIHNLADPSEPVIGYVSCGNVQSKRIFISNSGLPAHWQPVYPYSCSLDPTLFVEPISHYQAVADLLIPLPSKFLIVSEIAGASGGLLGYSRTNKQCADCTIRGTKQKPAFWK